MTQDGRVQLGYKVNASDQNVLRSMGIHPPGMMMPGAAAPSGAWPQYPGQAPMHPFATPPSQSCLGPGCSTHGTHGAHPTSCPSCRHAH